MGLVIEGIFALALLLLVLWLVSLSRSLSADRIEAAAQRQQEQEARERAEREARLSRPGEPLRCLSCGTEFFGPLSATGCPHCQLAAFVVAQQDVRP